MKWYERLFFFLAGFLLVLFGSAVVAPPKPTSNHEIKTLLIETQRNQLELAAMVLYSEDRIKDKIEQSRPKPLLPEVR